MEADRIAFNAIQDLWPPVGIRQLTHDDISRRVDFINNRYVYAPGVTTGLLAEGAMVRKLNVRSQRTGAVVEHTCLISQMGRHIYVLVRRIRNAIYGEVLFGIPCVNTSDGVVKLDDGDNAVAIKRLDMRYVAARGADANNPNWKQEDALVELCAIRMLSHPGNPHVVSPLAVLQDGRNLYKVIIVLSCCVVQML
jgi:hypothetical protein